MERPVPFFRRPVVRAFGTLWPRRASDWFQRVMETPTRQRQAPARDPGVPPSLRRLPYGEGWLHVTEWGAGPAVLLVHGWSSSSAALMPLVAPLVAAGFRVVAFDLPGHGRSDGSRTNLVACAGAALLVGRTLGALAGIIGHGFGGAVAVLAARYGLSAERVVLLAPPLSMDVTAIPVGDALGLPRRVSAGLFHRFAARYRLGADERQTDRAAARLDVPLLVIHDRDDPVVPWGHGEAVATAAPRGRLITTRGLGHLRLLDDPGVQEAAAGFVGGAIMRRLSA